MGNSSTQSEATHHLPVVGIEGLLIQGKFLWAQRLEEFDHVRKLQKGQKKVKDSVLDKDPQSLLENSPLAVPPETHWTVINETLSRCEITWRACAIKRVCE